MTEGQRSTRRMKHIAGLPLLEDIVRAELYTTWPRTSRRRGWVGEVVAGSDAGGGREMMRCARLGARLVEDCAVTSSAKDKEWTW